MKFLFIVQGEGRGHLTQALSLSQILSRRGIELTAVCVGTSKRREIPSFFSEKINAPILKFESPNFVTDKANRSVKLGSTIIYNFLKSTTFSKSLKEIHHTVLTNEPDVILNFYEVLGGIYNFFYRPKSKFWAIGHQYLIEHPDFEFPNGHLLQKLCFKFNTKITALGAESKFALAFRSFRHSSVKGLYVLPPLLRQELKTLATTNENFYLVYMVNSGYGEEVENFAKAHPEIEMLVFWDKKEAPNVYKPLQNICFYQVNDTLFLEKMASCKALICTAGFESVCEAMYLGKPAMMIPVQGQYEQLCNAQDAVQSGAGLSSKGYDFLTMEKFLKANPNPLTNSTAWLDGFEALFFQILDESLPATLQPI